MISTFKGLNADNLTELIQIIKDNRKDLYVRCEAEMDCNGY